LGIGAHPALIDIATAGAQDLIPTVDLERDFLVPVGYGRVDLYQDLGPDLTSHVRLRESDEATSLASFDVTIFDPSGAVVAQVSDFTMMRLQGSSMPVDEAGGPDWLRDAISPTEGMEVMRRLLGRACAPHVLVSPRPLPVLVSEIDSAARNRRPGLTRTQRPSMPEVDITPVEEALRGHEAVADIAALAAPELNGGVRVVAFVVFESGRQATVSELRRFVRGQVERSLVPKNFVELTALPLGQDGEIDRSELRDPFAEVDDFVAPRTATEGLIASIWEELLGLDRAGVHDNFLDAGGHSLVGIRVLVRIEKATGVRLQANSLTLQSLGQLAAEVDRAAGISSEGAK
jgi:hypothetical protein